MFRIILNQLHVSLGIVTQLSASWHESRVPTLYSSIWHIHIKLSQSITFYSQQYITVLGFYEGFSSLSSLSFFSLSISYRFKKSYLGIPIPGFLVSLNILNPISNQTILQQNSKELNMSRNSQREMFWPSTGSEYFSRGIPLFEHYFSSEINPI